MSGLAGPLPGAAAKDGTKQARVSAIQKKLKIFVLIIGTTLRRTERKILG
jgi:hypothetical protein